MRTITLRGVLVVGNRWEGPTRRLTDAEFQAKRDKGLVFGVMNGIRQVVVRIVHNRNFECWLLRMGLTNWSLWMMKMILQITQNFR